MEHDNNFLATTTAASLPLPNQQSTFLARHDQNDQAGISSADGMVFSAATETSVAAPSTMTTTHFSQRRHY
jgi:UDP-N-acetyl-D-mannosaminuronic acid transferase (WecB/TagA/CpsF family)